MAKVTIKAKIIDIDVNPKAKKAIISVELDDGKRQWNKAIGIDLVDYVIPFEEFKQKLADMVIEDLDADVALSDIKKRKGSTFNLTEIDEV